MNADHLHRVLAILRTDFRGRVFWLQNPESGTILSIQYRESERCCTDYFHENSNVGCIIYTCLGVFFG